MIRKLLGPALAATLAIGLARPARAQSYYGPAPGAAVRVYPFRNESLFSINNSYLGYGNLAYVGEGPPSPGYVTAYGRARNQGYLVDVSQVPPPPRTFRSNWFARRRARGN